jgi:hypothetical protein
MAMESQLEHPLVEQLLEELFGSVPEYMDRGTVLLLENQTWLGDPQNPFIAVCACPRCGLTGLITRQQLRCGETMICGGDDCSAEFFIEDGGRFRFRVPQ